MEQRRRRLAQRTPVPRRLTVREWEAIRRAWNGRCAWCDATPPDPLTKDHLIPLARGGQHAADNVVPACRDCNARHADRAPSAELLRRAGEIAVLIPPDRDRVRPRPVFIAAPAGRPTWPLGSVARVIEREGR